MIQQRTQTQLSGDLRLHLANACLVFITAFGWWSEARALTADSEGAVLVNTVGTGFNRTELIRLTESDATVSTSNQILNSVQSGIYENIIASMPHCCGTSSQVLGIPWMTSGNSSHAAASASLAQNLPLPAASTDPEPRTVLVASPSSFGSETRNTENDIEPAAQIIEVAPLVTDGTNAVNSGVALITAMAHGNFSSMIDHFYSAGVLGDVVPILSPADLHGAPASVVGLRATK